MSRGCPPWVSPLGSPLGFVGVPLGFVGVPLGFHLFEFLPFGLRADAHTPRVADQESRVGLVCGPAGSTQGGASFPATNRRCGLQMPHGATALQTLTAQVVAWNEADFVECHIDNNRAGGTS